MHERKTILNYDEAVEAIQKVGILPLASFVPDHPSLTAITKSENWHTDTDDDPWRWRVRFPADGVAAYGKFLKKKGVFISVEILPLVVAILGSPRELSERYADGLVSREAYQLYEIINTEQGIDTRSLRVAAGMKAKEMKRSFDNALVELQSSLDIVISGVHVRRNDKGEVSGWNSTSFETRTHWMKYANIAIQPLEVEQAKAHLHHWLKERCSERAMTFFAKIFDF